MKIGMLFSGYGSQFVGMAKELYDESRIIQEYFEEASNCLGINFVKLCFASSDVELAKIVHAYPALFLVGVSTSLMIKEELGLNINYVAGHGIGEYGALCFAGGISFPDGLYLIAKLAHYYVQVRYELDLKSGIVKGISTRKLQQICKEQSSKDHCAQIAIYEREKEHIITGHASTVDIIIQRLESEGSYKVKKIDTLEGFHTPILEQLFEQIQIYLNKVDFKDLKIPLITNVNGKFIQDAKKAQDAVMHQIIKPIYWSTVLKQFADVDLIIVPSPSKSLVIELKSYYPNKIIVGIDSKSDIEKLKEIVNKLNESSVANFQSSDSLKVDEKNE